MIVEYLKGGAVPLSLNFNSSEFDCHCSYPECQITYIDSDLVTRLQIKRSAWNNPIEIKSGFRCARHNKEVDGKPGSIHLMGKAADIKVSGMIPSAVAFACEGFDGLGRYPTFTHVDIRGYKARWTGK